MPEAGGEERPRARRGGRGGGATGGPRRRAEYGEGDEGSPPSEAIARDRREEGRRGAAAETEPHDEADARRREIELREVDAEQDADHSRRQRPEEGDGVEDRAVAHRARDLSLPERREVGLDEERLVGRTRDALPYRLAPSLLAVHQRDDGGDLEPGRLGRLDGVERRAPRGDDILDDHHPRSGRRRVLDLSLRAVGLHLAPHHEPREGGPARGAEQDDGGGDRYRADDRPPYRDRPPGEGRDLFEDDFRDQREASRVHNRNTAVEVVPGGLPRGEAHSLRAVDEAELFDEAA